jgi:hypothetical protein
VSQPREKLGTSQRDKRTMPRERSYSDGGHHRTQPHSNWHAHSVTTSADQLAADVSTVSRASTLHLHSHLASYVHLPPI